jgi:hypothetical protein
MEKSIYTGELTIMSGLLFVKFEHKAKLCWNGTIMPVQFLNFIEDALSFSIAKEDIRHFGNPYVGPVPCFLFLKRRFNG